MTAAVKLRVRAVHAEAADVVSVELAHADGRPVADMAPGAHLRLHLAGPVVRQYTLCNGPQDRDAYRLAVKREAVSRGGSAAVHALQPGDEVVCEGPFNHFEVDWSQPHLVLVAAGIGITPILSMALHARARGHSFEVHHFVRTPAHALFQQRLQGVAGDRLSLHAGLAPDQVSVRLRQILDGARTGSGLYLCGPAVFMTTARKLAEAAPAIAAVRFESFGAGPADAAGAAGASSAAQADGPASPVAETFRVRLARSGGEYDVPADRSILDVLESAGIDVPCSCREGVCGMCVTELVEGEPDHRDEFLSDASKADGRLIAICVSRARSATLVLDL